MIKTLDEIIVAVQSKPQKRLLAVNANDDHTIEAVYDALENGIIEATLIGDAQIIKAIFAKKNYDINKVKLIHEKDENIAASTAVSMINKGEADFLMKGLLSTDKYMRAILNKENGLMPNAKSVLSHVTVMEVPSYHKLMIAGDVAIIPAPDLQQKIAIANYLISVAKNLEINQPKLAVIAATEQMLPAMQACVDAAIISKMAERGQIKGALVDGPLGFDLAVDKESVEIKQIKSQVAGDADCLLFPNIETGNMFYKSLTKLCKGNLAAMVVGAKVPCVLTSRGDSARTKLYSIALAALSAK